MHCYAIAIASCFHWIVKSLCWSSFFYLCCFCSLLFCRLRCGVRRLELHWLSEFFTLVQWWWWSWTVKTAGSHSLLFAHWWVGMCLPDLDQLTSIEKKLYIMIHKTTKQESWQSNQTIFRLWTNDVWIAAMVPNHGQSVRHHKPKPWPICKTSFEFQVVQWSQLCELSHGLRWWRQWQSGRAWRLSVPDYRLGALCLRSPIAEVWPSWLQWTCWLHVGLCLSMTTFVLWAKRSRSTRC